MTRLIPSAALCIVLFATAGVVAQDAVLFPEPLHLVREIAGDAGEPGTIDEYGDGNRIVRIAGDRVTVTDYGKAEILEIDRAHGTFSVTTFDALARAKAALAQSHPSPPAGGDEYATTALAPNRVRITGPQLQIDMRVDESVTLSRDAFDALSGAAYPESPRPEHAVIAAATRVARPGRFAPVADAAAARYALPVEQQIELRAGDERVPSTSRVVRIVREPIPPELLIIPPGSRQVEANLIRLARELESLDRVTVPLH